MALPAGSRRPISLASIWWVRAAIATRWGLEFTLRAGGITQTREVEGGGSFMSQSDPRAHFGLGSVNRAESVEIRWPSGLRQVLRNVAGDAFYRIAEGKYRLEREASERTRGTSGSR